MSTDKDDKPPTANEILQGVETILDGVAADHEAHDCGTTELAMGLSATVKLKREALSASGAGEARSIAEYESAKAGRSSGGPAQVATAKYRSNYDAIFMSKGGSA